MWTVIYIAQKKEGVKRLQALLEQHGIIVRVRKMAKAEEEQECYEVLVPAGEVSRAHDLIFDADI